MAFRVLAYCSRHQFPFSHTFGDTMEKWEGLIAKKDLELAMAMRNEEPASKIASLEWKRRFLVARVFVLGAFPHSSMFVVLYKELVPDFPHPLKVIDSPRMTDIFVDSVINQGIETESELEMLYRKRLRLLKLLRDAAEAGRPITVLFNRSYRQIDLYTIMVDYPPLHEIASVDFAEMVVLRSALPTADWRLYETPVAVAYPTPSTPGEGLEQAASWLAALKQEEGDLIWHLLPGSIYDLQLFAYSLWSKTGKELREELDIDLPSAAMKGDVVRAHLMQHLTGSKASGIIDDAFKQLYGSDSFGAVSTPPESATILDVVRADFMQYIMDY